MLTNDSKLNIVLALKDNATKALKEATKSLSLLEGQMNTSKAGSLALAGGIAAVATGVALLGKAAIGAAAQYEQSEIAFSTMLGSAEHAQSLLNELAEFAKRTPFELVGIEASAKQLLAMGIGVEDMMPTLKSLGDIAAGLSVPLSRLALNFGQVKTQGKLTGRELRDFSMAGVPLIAQLAEQLGVSKARISEMVSEGKIGFAEVEQAFKDMTSEGGKFNDLMDAQSKTLIGMISNLKDAWNLFLRAEGQALLDWAKKVVEILTWIVNEVLPKVIILFKSLTFFVAGVAFAFERAYLEIKKFFATITLNIPEFEKLTKEITLNKLAIKELWTEWITGKKPIEDFVSTVKESGEVISVVTEEMIKSFESVAKTIVDEVRKQIDAISDLREELKELANDTDEQLSREEDRYDANLKKMARAAQDKIDIIDKEIADTKKTMSRGWRDRITELEAEKKKEKAIIKRIGGEIGDVEKEAKKDELTVLQEAHQKEIDEINKQARLKKEQLETDIAEKEAGIAQGTAAIMAPGFFEGAAKEEMGLKPWEQSQLQNIFNFNFEGDVSDKDELIKVIIDAINRAAELSAVGGQ